MKKKLIISMFYFFDVPKKHIPHTSTPPSHLSKSVVASSRFFIYTYINLHTIHKYAASRLIQLNPPYDPIILTLALISCSNVETQRAAARPACSRVEREITQCVLLCFIEHSFIWLCVSTYVSGTWPGCLMAAIWPECYRRSACTSLRVTAA